MTIRFLSLQKPTALSAADYYYCLMEWVQNQIRDETIFPADESVEFPKNFQKTCKKILTRMFRVFVHIYIHHFDKMTSLNAEGHANTLFKHYYYFVKEFDLVDARALEPLQDLIDRICKD